MKLKEKKALGSLSFKEKNHSGNFQEWEGRSGYYGTFGNKRQGFHAWSKNIQGPSQSSQPVLTGKIEHREPEGLSAKKSLGS